MKKAKQILVIIIFIIIISGFYYFYNIKKTQHDTISYRDEFHYLNRDFWYVGEWETMFKAYNRVYIKNDVLTADVKMTDRGPFFLSKPIPVQEGDVITVKRRVKLHYGNDKFSGGLAILETNDVDLRPKMLENGWGNSLGQALALIEYVHFYGENLERPGSDNFRVLGPAWKDSNSYALMEPIYDEWFEEKLVYNTRNNEILYTYGDEIYKVKGKKLTKPYIRVFMHSYGWNTGHSMKLDWIDIKIENEIR